ncbi:MAG: roadblock/LC7 domain-containing protein [Promethearchaeota archaeon]
MENPDTTETLEEILKNLSTGIPEIISAAIVSVEGLPIASALPNDVDETRIAAMTAALLSLAERAVHEMKKGEFEQLLVKGSDGYLLVLAAGMNAVLTVSTTSDVKLGLIFLDCRRTCEKIAKLI